MRLGDMTAGRILDLAEVAGEADLLLVGDVLVVEHKDGVTVHPRLDRHDIAARQWRPQIDPRNLAGEDGVDLANRDGHRTNSRYAPKPVLCPLRRQSQRRCRKSVMSTPGEC